MLHMCLISKQRQKGLSAGGNQQDKIRGVYGYLHTNPSLGQTEQYGFVPETCWIAHVKQMSGLAMRKAPNRKSAAWVKPCPPQKVESIRAALRHFGMI